MYQIKLFSLTIFYILFRALNHQIAAERIIVILNFLLKLAFRSLIRFHTNPGFNLKLAVITTCPGTFTDIFEHCMLQVEEKLKHLDLINNEYIKKDGKNLKFKIFCQTYPFPMAPFAGLTMKVLCFFLFFSSLQ